MVPKLLELLKVDCNMQYLAPDFIFSAESFLMRALVRRALVSNLGLRFFVQIYHCTMRKGENH